MYFTTIDKKDNGACLQVQEEIIWVGAKDFTKEVIKDEFDGTDRHQMPKALGWQTSKAGIYLSGNRESGNPGRILSHSPPMHMGPQVKR